MLNPDTRSLYTAAVTPPPGYVFDQAMATTYSLDPSTLLSLPTHLALADRSSTATIAPIRLLESLRRLSGRFNVYVDHTGIKPPSGSNVLFGLLENMVTPVKAPRGGAFHPKIWVLRFVQPDLDNEPPLIRLLILSRNITYDRSWDISLQLEGQPQGRYIGANRPIGELVKALPSMAVHPVSRTKLDLAEKLADEVRKTPWELPEGFEEIYFHILGIGRKSWTPPWSKRMGVISPFVTDRALSWLNSNTQQITSVISRPDELNQLSPESMEIAQRWYTLDEAAETEDGEELEQHDTVGLHAKVYIVEKGWWTHLYLGSANATSAALLERINTEIIVELVGRTSRVGGVETLIADSGLGPVLAEYVRPEEPPAIDDEEAKARNALEKARDLLAETKLKLTCKKSDEAWKLLIKSSERLCFDGISKLKAWPITVSEDRAVDTMGLARHKSVDIGQYATESVTGLIAFELVSEIKNISLRMVLSLPVEGLPENRDDAIFQLVLNNQDGFLRYILLLLGEYTGGILGGGSLFNRGSGSGSWSDGFSSEIPILEELARAFSRDPDKLKDVEAVIKRLMQNKKTNAIVPPQFLEMWTVFKEALAEAGR